MSKHTAALLSAAALAFTLGGAAAPVQAAADAALLAAAMAAQPALIESLKDMVVIESGSADAEGLARMADYVERRLAAAGAGVERVKPAKGTSALVKGTFTGSGTRRVLLIAHMDTVYPAGTLTTQPIRLDGPGIADDKGGIAVILHALDILKARGWRDYARPTVLLNADEETGSTGSGELIAAAADEHDVVLSCEPTAARAVFKSEALLLGASGTAIATLKVGGRSAHAGAAPQLGRNALIELAHQLVQTRDVARDVPGTQLNWTRAQADGPSNQIPERAMATADVRLTARDGAERLQAALRKKVQDGALVPDTKTTVTMQVGRPAFVANETGLALAQRAPPSSRASGWQATATTRDEYIELDSIVPRLYLLTRLLTTL